jgi:hypothetical protein
MPPSSAVSGAPSPPQCAIVTIRVTKAQALTSPAYARFRKLQPNERFEE